MKKNMRVCAYVNLDNAVYNMDSMYKNLKPETKMMAVIKTDGYGHGAAAIANKIEALPYLFGFAVATAEEAVALRNEGIKKPILILGFTFNESYEDIVKYDIRPAVFKFDMAKQLSYEAVKQNKTVNFHIKLDTGMGRIGFKCNDSSIEDIIKISKLPNVCIEGMFTHFAKADMTDINPTLIQIEKYDLFAEKLKEKGVDPQIKHLLNSAGIIRFSESCHDMVRAGITLYGLWPSDETPKDIIDLKPLMEIKSHIAYIKEVEKDTAISYGGTFVANKTIKIATIPVGYGDGYPRSLSNKGYVLIKGQRAPIVGRVCMDQFMVDVSAVEGVAEFDEVTLIGNDGDLTLSMEELGNISGRFNYELSCDIGRRVPRVYI